MNKNIKRITQGLAVVAFIVTGVAQAQYSEEPKETRDLPKLISPYETRTIETVRTMPDDTYVTVEGLLTKQIAGSDDKYLLEDKSGEIIVEIDEKLWRGQVVSKTTPVKILGELDQDKRAEKVKIEALYIEALPKN